MEQASKRYVVGFNLSTKAGQTILSPVFTADDEKTAGDLANDLLQKVKSIPKEYIGFLDLIGISGIGVTAMGIPLGATSSILVPQSGIIVP